MNGNHHLNPHDPLESALQSLVPVPHPMSTAESMYACGFAAGRQQALQSLQQQPVVRYRQLSLAAAMLLLVGGAGLFGYRLGGAGLATPGRDVAWANRDTTAGVPAPQPTVPPIPQSIPIIEKLTTPSPPRSQPSLPWLTTILPQWLMDQASPLPLESLPPQGLTVRASNQNVDRLLNQRWLTSTYSTPATSPENEGSDEESTLHAPWTPYSYPPDVAGWSEVIQ